MFGSAADHGCACALLGLFGLAAAHSGAGEPVRARVHSGVLVGAMDDGIRRRAPYATSSAPAVVIPV